MGEDGVQVERQSILDEHESQELHVPDPLDPTNTLTNTHTNSVQPESAGVCAITVLTLLDQLVKMLDQVQEDQNRLEQRQAQVEGAVLGIQNNITKLSKNHSSTANTLSKLLDKSRKISVHMKEVRDRMEKQAVQVRKLEANHRHLLCRDNFRVLIFQEENEIPSTVFVKDSPPFPRDAENESVTLDPNRSQEELQTIQLSSDEELGPDDEEEEEDEEHDVLELVGEQTEKSRAEKIKRSSLKKVDSLKKAFSKQNFEKKMNKIVSAEKREKIKKSLTPSHSGSKGTSFRVSPLFGRKKVKEIQEEAEGDQTTEGEGSSVARAPVEITPINIPEQSQNLTLTFSQVHSQLAPDQEELMMEKEDVMMKEGEEVMEEEKEGEGLSEGYSLSATLPQDVATETARNALQGEEAEEEEEGKDRYKGTDEGTMES